MIAPMVKNTYGTSTVGRAILDMNTLKDIVESYISVIPGVTYLNEGDRVKVDCCKDFELSKLNVALVSTILSGFGLYVENITKGDTVLFFNFIEIEEYISREEGGLFE